METLETRLAQLQLMTKRSEKVAKKSEDAIERHTTSIKSIIAEVASAKMVEEAKKIAAKEDMEVIKTWGSDTEKTIDEADRVVRQLKEIVKGHNEESLRLEHEKELEYERKLFETKLQYKKELCEASVSGNLVKKEKPSSVSPSAIPAKLPKLHINRFDGSYEDWPRFWNQFVEIIDKTEMPCDQICIFEILP